MSVTTPRRLFVARCPSCAGEDMRTVGFPREISGLAFRRRRCDACGETSILMSAYVEGPLLDLVADYLADQGEVDIDALFE